ncbi:hypothetical protein GCM10023195_61150 [Actinoallomurus liliacearum]|uniref:Uncharacterized protein n=1 Tax=Actinoallomurus liliacearum TaxID=1080073 RepID=A0ABP8TVP7_9ACTN
MGNRATGVPAPDLAITPVPGPRRTVPGTEAMGTRRTRSRGTPRPATAKEGTVRAVTKADTLHSRTARRSSTRGMAPATPRRSRRSGAASR